MKSYQEILTTIANRSVSELPAVEPSPDYWKTLHERYHQVAGMVELARHLEMPVLFIAALEEHRDRLKPARDVDAD
jgi:deoxyadenosine/deoxycytidine kinase